jgi:L-arabinose isomerase
MKTQKPKIGLLPLYLELYDIILPKIKPEFKPFIDSVCSQFKSKGIDVVLSDVCRISKEFGDAIKQFEKADVDCIVTLHLAYSPSLECVESLAKTKLPVIVLDTTPDECYNSMSLLMYNHGIHGVQDMCNMLKRFGKDYIIEAGHIKSSDVTDRVVCHIKGAQVAHKIKSSRVGRVGEAFIGMGDFTVEQSVLKKKIGMKICTVLPEQVAIYLPDINNPEVNKEMKEDKKRFDLSRVSIKAHKLSVQTGLALRRWIEKEKLTAFSVNFQSIIKADKLPVMPFLEISKAMSRGIGYAGEGDVLTASLVGALAQVLGRVSFTEMFCPDWKNSTIFLSHMGEINIDLTEDKPTLIEMDWTFTDAQPPVYPSACFKRGEALLVNLAPGPNDTFSLIISPVNMVKEPNPKNMGDGIRGWMKPKMPVPDFLKAYSEAGGTHHSALVYGDAIEELKSFGRIMDWKVVVLN